MTGYRQKCDFRIVQEKDAIVVKYGGEKTRFSHRLILVSFILVDIFNKTDDSKNKEYKF